MTPQDVSKTLKVIGTVFRGILAPGADRVLADAQAQVQQYLAQSQKNQGKWRRSARIWGYQIFAERPLQFAGAQVKKHQIEVDLHCKFAWSSDPVRGPLEQLLVLRVWSPDTRLRFREEWDAQAIREAVEKRGRRVLARYHFDLANPEQPGPRYHLQIGGVANFFAAEYRSIRKDPEWKRLILDMQRLVLSEYFEHCRKVVNAAEPSQSLLDELWHEQWQ